MGIKDHLSAANQATPPANDVADGTELPTATPQHHPAADERLEKASDLIGRIIFFPGRQPFAGPKVQGRSNPIDYNNAAYLITGETGGQTYTGNFINFMAIQTADKKPFTLDKVMPRASNQPVFDERIGSIQVRCGGNLSSVFFLSSSINLDGRDSKVIPHQGLSMTQVTDYGRLHSLLSGQNPAEFIPFVGQQEIAANVLCTHLKHGRALLCPTDTPNLLTMDSSETEHVINEATKRFRHPVITSPAMIFHV